MKNILMSLIPSLCSSLTHFVNTVNTIITLLITYNYASTSQWYLFNGNFINLIALIGVIWGTSCKTKLFDNFLEEIKNLKEENSVIFDYKRYFAYTLTIILSSIIALIVTINLIKNVDQNSDMTFTLIEIYWIIVLITGIMQLFLYCFDDLWYRYLVLRIRSRGIIFKYNFRRITDEYFKIEETTRTYDFLSIILLFVITLITYIYGITFIMTCPSIDIYLGYNCTY